MTQQTASSNAAKAFLGYSKNKSFTELVKIINMPALKHSKNDYNGTGKDWKEFLNDNEAFKKILVEAGDQMFGKGYDIKKDMYCMLNIEGDFSKQLNEAYFYVSGDSCVYLVDNLDKFSESRQTEKQWLVAKWIEIW